jgi:hypothetical protein
VTSAMRRHMSSGAIDEALGALPAEIRALIMPADGQNPGQGDDQGDAAVPGRAGDRSQAGGAR